MNMFSSKRGQLNLEKFMINAEKLNNNYFNQKRKNIFEENKDKKPYSKQESKYNLKQILKNYNLNRIGKKNGFTKEYLHLLTDLLYENNRKNYSMKRLCLVDFRKKILKNKISLSFQNFIEKDSLSERIHNKIYLTNLDQKSYNLKSENKTLTNFSSKITKSKYFHNKKELSSIDFLKKVNLRINLDSNFSSRNTKATTISESNTYDHPSKNKMNKIKSRTIESYTYKKTDNEDKYKWYNDPKEEYLENNNKIKFINYLNNKYKFYKYKTLEEKKNIKEIHKRQNIFNKEIIKLNKKIDFPYKKEFFSKFNRLKMKNIYKINVIG